MRKKLIAANWKMNGSIASIKALLSSIMHNIPKSKAVDCVIFPPAVYLPLVSELLRDSGIHWGGQNIYPQESGAYTGELSCSMMLDFGCRYILVGHSERRHLFSESENLIREKFHKIKEHGIIPVLCVGETLKERENGLTEQVLTRQLTGLLSENATCFQQAVIAYEPVWAIGTGVHATAEQVEAAHQAIRRIIASYDENLAEKTPILYGGSLNEKNAAELLAIADVDGGLIGGASLDAHKFVEIIACIN